MTGRSADGERRLDRERARKGGNADGERRLDRESDEGWRDHADGEGRLDRESDEGWRDRAGDEGRLDRESDEGWRDHADGEGRLDRESDEGWRDHAGDEGRLDRAQGERRFCPQEEDRGVRGLWRGMLARGRRRFGRDENGRGLLARGAAGARRHWEAMWLAATLCVLVALLMAFAPRALPVRRFSAQARVASNGLIRQGEEVRVDLNSADSALLSGLPGIGDALAQRIVAYRVANGPFLSVESLTQVPGIGPRKLAKLRYRVAVTR